MVLIVMKITQFVFWPFFPDNVFVLCFKNSEDAYFHMML